MNNSNGNLRVITLSSSDHSFGVRDDHGFRCFLPRVHHYTGQDERYEKEKADIEAFANLFASAPDLLKEMERMLPVLERLENDNPGTWSDLTQGTGIATVNAYRAAIARAKGEIK